MGARDGWKNWIPGDRYDSMAGVSVMVLRAAAFVMSVAFLYLASRRNGLAMLLVIISYLMAYAVGLRSRARIPVLNTLLVGVDQLLIAWSIVSTGGLGSSAYLLYFVELMLISPYGGIALSLSVALVSSLGYMLVTMSDMVSLSDWLILWFRSSCLLLVAAGSGFWGERIGLHLSLLRREQQESLLQLRSTEELAEINQGLLARLEEDAAMELVLNKGMQLLHADGAIAILFAEQVVQVVQAVGVLAAWKGMSLEQGDELLKLVQAPPGIRNWLGSSAEGWSHVLSAELSLQGELRQKGALQFVRTRTSKAFNSHDEQSLQNLASSLSLSLNRARLYGQLQKRNAHLLLLNEIGRSLSANLDMEQLFETMYTEVSKVMSTDAFFVALYDARTEQVDFRCLYDRGQRYPGTVAEINSGPTSRAIRSGKPVLWNIDSRHIPGANFLGEPGRFVQSVLVVPMKTGQRVIGAVSSQSYSANAYADEHVQLLETVASQAAVLLANVRLYERTRELSLTDSMTGLANARRFYQELEQTLNAAREQEGRVSLLMVDSDSLKQINDRYGHPAGDQHIVTLAAIIRGQIRASDLAARYAGDEFMVVLPGADRDAAHIIAERIREAVAQHYLDTEGGTVAATVSIGVAVYPDDADTSEALFKAADEAMYQAKHGGRNRVSLMRGN